MKEINLETEENEDGEVLSDEESTEFIKLLEK